MEGNYYTVQKGDSLWSIATKFGLTVNELKTLNNLKSNIVNIGQNLLVKKEEEKQVEDYLLYTVKANDTLYKIANDYNTTVNTIMNLNNLTSDNLTINQQLLLPKKQNLDIDIDYDVDTIKYTVMPGDTLYKIANSYNVSVNKLKDINNLNSDILSIGQELMIPTDETKVEEKNNNTSGINYIVKPGDNLYSIANKYKVNVDDIKDINNLKNNTIVIGQILKIPGTESYAAYSVEEGDTLYGIANKYGVSVSDLMKINNLEGTLITPGQELLLPTK